MIKLIDTSAVSSATGATITHLGDGVYIWEKTVVSNSMGVVTCSVVWLDGTTALFSELYEWSCDPIVNADGGNSTPTRSLKVDPMIDKKTFTFSLGKGTTNILGLTSSMVPAVGVNCKIRVRGKV